MAVLVAGGGGLSVRAARIATTTIPIVFTSGADPVQTGLVTSLRRPEGNVTGVSFASRALAQKRLELIGELLPKATAIAVLQNSENPIRPDEMAELNAAAAALGQQLHLLSAALSPRSTKLLFSLASSGLTPLFSMVICFSPANAT